MVLLGVSVWLSGCSTKTMVEAPPKLCPTFTFAAFEDQTALAEERVAPSLRAWVRETEKVCRANEALLGVE